MLSAARQVATGAGQVFSVGFFLFGCFYLLLCVMVDSDVVVVAAASAYLLIASHSPALLVLLISICDSAQLNLETDQTIQRTVSKPVPTTTTTTT